MRKLAIDICTQRLEALVEVAQGANKGTVWNDTVRHVDTIFKVVNDRLKDIVLSWLLNAFSLPAWRRPVASGELQFGDNSNFAIPVSDGVHQFAG